MAQNARQKATSNLRRGSRPVFQFTNLPAELQLLILNRCDMISIERLLSVSLYVRSLCIQYPEIVIQGSLSEIPQPFAGFLHVATALHNISVDIYVEVDVAADIVAQSMNAAMQIYIDPQVAVTPVVLSVAEHTRLVCALLIVKIYYQLRSKFVPNGRRSMKDFATAFMQTLAPWQIAQSSSVEGFLDSCQKFLVGLYDEIIDNRYTCCECLFRGWIMYRTVSPDDMMRRHLVWRVGMLFWCQSRLAGWGMVDSSDVVTLGRQTAWRLGYMRRRYPYSLQQGHIEDTTSQQTIEWTRSHEQINFEEFLARQLG
ncbi:hypothetical protein COCMIDRAFT_33986 [Bipolaris oryzae ATCC 44560]|uniref:F-box domain-containing protein n=1 Tax=Bipolaris oryzae ATCC 44560 TaxID=930090 RepID=W6ZF39_COCMI|nr:uncharacterized protein COCMIDRAFT_33986 [Bipolaris oryzae ATCC 44560]EUC48503.1 hypothetical protein COCMIDRAFT_33986 [Bipolaris oryzae ATCC 44560]